MNALRRARPRPAGRVAGGGRAVPAGPVALVLAASLLTACTTGAADGGPDLAGRSFVSTDVRGHELVADSRIRLIFGEDTISAMAGCNTVFGGASWDGGTLVVDDALATTMMACSGELMDQDDWLEQFLLSGPTLNLDGQTLTVGDDAGGLTFEQE
ncbi:META domain-containing protein [Georgenia yuyongxinii]|uniref:META domain-containing protein n=1 Tax=Georgenia yuyongxinii TaxID=2589797 RepID=A0A552WMW1_9MICO|nr:META domain-containing protein [Georgenia yuyongxinii]TRW44080.1 META domain-containing protein [Georgenia yuyongxinii]